MTVTKSAGDMNNNDVIFLKSYSRTKCLNIFFFFLGGSYPGEILESFNISQNWICAFLYA